MASVDDEPGDGRRPGRLARAVVQLGVLALVLCAGVALTYQRGVARRDLAQVLHQARAAAAAGNAGDLHRALTLVEGARPGTADAPQAVALQAALWADLWLLHREPGAEARARTALERAVALDARTDERFAAQCLLRLEQGDAAGAAELAEARRREGFSGPRLLLAQGRALQALGDLPLARAALALAADGAQHDGNFPAALGEALLEQGVPGAPEAFRTALELSPNLWRAKLGLSLARARLRQHLPEAEAAVAEALGHAPELSAPQRARAIAVQAGLQLARGDAEVATATARRALDLEPLDRWAAFFHAAALAARRQPDAAAAFDALTRRAPDAPPFALEGAAALQGAGQVEAALALLDRYRDFFQPLRVAALDGGQGPALARDDLYWLTRGDALAAAGRDAQALAAYDAALAARAGHLPQAQYAKAAFLLARKDPAAAEPLLLELTPDDGSGTVPEAYLALGELRLGQRDFGAGTRAYALGLARLAQTQAPAARRAQLFADVKRRLVAAGQTELARLWEDEAKPLTR
jgi:hypothetical protein